MYSTSTKLLRSTLARIAVTMIIIMANVACTSNKYDKIVLYTNRQLNYNDSLDLYNFLKDKSNKIVDFTVVRLDYKNQSESIAVKYGFINKLRKEYQIEITQEDLVQDLYSSDKNIILPKNLFLPKNIKSPKAILKINSSKLINHNDKSLFEIIKKECDNRKIKGSNSTIYILSYEPVKFKGIPEKDSDGDGVNDKIDKCPNDKGPKSTNGCPDSDSDGIPDIEDKCPNQKGLKRNMGCPKIPINTAENKKQIVSGFDDPFIQNHQLYATIENGKSIKWNSKIMNPKYQTVARIEIWSVNPINKQKQKVIYRSPLINSNFWDIKNISTSPELKQTRYNDIIDVSYVLSLYICNKEDINKQISKDFEFAISNNNYEINWCTQLPEKK